MSDVVEGNDLVKEHQVDVLERLAVLDLTSHARLAVAEVVVGEVADQTARKGRQLGKAGAFVACKDLTQICRRIVGHHGQVARLHHAIDAGDLHLWVIAHKSVATPSVIRLRGLEHIAVGGNIFENFHRFDRSDKVRKKLAAERNDVVPVLLSDCPDAFKRGKNLHNRIPPAPAIPAGNTERIGSKKVLNRAEALLRTNKQNIRGATLISRHDPCSQRDTNISPTYDVCLNVAEYSEQGSFDCALRGPFDNLYLTRLSAPRALCRGMTAVISASTVSLLS